MGRTIAISSFVARAIHPCTAVNQVKDRIAARSSILVGHSMGCRVISEAFQQSGAAMSGLVFVDGSFLGDDLESTMKSTKAAITRQSRQTDVFCAALNPVAFTVT